MSTELPSLSKSTAKPNVTEHQVDELAKPIDESIAQCVSDQLSELFAELLPTLEEEDARTLKIINKQKGVPTPADLSYFEKNGFNVNQVVQEREMGFYRDQLRRLMHVQDDQAIAGTAEKREALAADAKEAQAKLATRGAELQDIIKRAQDELESLERSARSSEKRVAEASHAVDKLRAALHPKLKKMVEHLRVWLNEHYRGPFANGIDARKRELECLTDDLVTEEAILSHCRRLPRDHYCRYNGERAVTHAAWQQLQSEYKKELEELLPQWEAEKAALDAAYAELDGYRDYYVA